LQILEVAEDLETIHLMEDLVHQEELHLLNQAQHQGYGL
jgi:hypothetical protein